MSEKPYSEIGTLTWIAALAAIITGLVVYIFLKDILLSVSVFFIFIGVYELSSVCLRNHENDQFGTNDASASLLWGFLFLTVGGVALTFDYTGDILKTVIVGLAILLVYNVIRLVLRKKD
ncbi:MAG: hypothetical protein J5673_02810 [Candidatus Methanomethylophilaceae archaeon]|nr:hypothetical protein [Candidatus Methanomethylophilaceae archaeon]